MTLVRWVVPFYHPGPCFSGPHATGFLARVGSFWIPEFLGSDEMLACRCDYCAATLLLRFITHAGQFDIKNDEEGQILRVT